MDPRKQKVLAPTVFDDVVTLIESIPEWVAPGSTYKTKFNALKTLHDIAEGILVLNNTETLGREVLKLFKFDASLPESISLVVGALTGPERMNVKYKTYLGPQFTVLGERAESLGLGYWAGWLPKTADKITRVEEEVEEEEEDDEDEGEDGDDEEDENEDGYDDVEVTQHDPALSRQRLTPLPNSASSMATMYRLNVFAILTNKACIRESARRIVPTFVCTRNTDAFSHALKMFPLYAEIAESERRGRGYEASHAFHFVSRRHPYQIYTSPSPLFTSHVSSHYPHPSLTNRT